MTSQFSEQELRVLAQVLQMLSQGDIGHERLEEYLVAFAVSGRMVAQSEAAAERAEASRKAAYARAFADAKSSPDKISDRQAEALAEVAVETLRLAEIEERRKLSELRNIRESIREAIWAIKFLGRQDGSVGGY